MNMISAHTAWQADIAFQANLYTDDNSTRRGLHLARRRWVEDALAKHVLPTIRAIEVGVGCGIFTRTLATLAGSVTAVDINPKFIAGVSTIRGVTPLLADATTGQDLGSHDVALCSEVLEHVAPDKSLAMLAGLHNALKPGGVLILTTPQSFSMVEMVARLLKLPLLLALARRLYGMADVLGHTNLLTAARLKRQIADTGFVIESEARFGFYLPVIAEFGGERGWRLLEALGRTVANIPGLRGLLWTQAYVLRRH